MLCHVVSLCTVVLLYCAVLCDVLYCVMYCVVLCTDCVLRRDDTPARTSPAAEGEAVYWFGHTSGATPHLVPLCAVKAGQAACSTTLGDHAGTGCAERFFLRGADLGRIGGGVVVSL